MRDPVSDDYFSFMSERGKRKTPVPRPVAAVPPPTVPPCMPGVNPDSGMEVTESSISETMIRQIFKLRHSDEISATLDD